MEQTTPSSERPPASPARFDSFRTRSSGGGGNKSLESFAITTTPFHEPNEDGEYYMDETGNWLHRWVTTTEVKSAKVIKAEKRAERRRSARAEANPEREDSGWEEGPVAMDSGMGSSSSSEGVEEQKQTERPRLNRHSRSSFIPADRANHKSPERVHGNIQRDPESPAEQRQDTMRLEEVEPVPLEDVDLEPQSAGACDDGDKLAIAEAEEKLTEKPAAAPEAATKSPADASNEDLSLGRLTKALSCPASPTQFPIIPPGEFSSPPSPVLSRTRTADLDPLPSLDGSLPPVSHRNRRRASGSRSSTRTHRSRPNIHLHRNATEDPYLAHQRAVELFSPPPRSQPEPRPDTTRRASLTSPLSSTHRTISAAEFLASKPVEVPPSVSTWRRRSSQADSLPRSKQGTTEVVNELSQSTSRSTLNQHNSQSRHASAANTSSAEAEDTDSSRGVSLVPMLVDHRIALDWTHPETRERAERRRKGVLGKVRRLLSRSRSRTRSREEGYDDSGSVRRLRVESVGKLVREEAVDIQTEKADGNRDRLESIVEKPGQRNRRRLSCFR